MEYSSFYGGRRGSSFVLRKSYTSVLAMLEDFQRSDCTVNFGQYVLINTDNKLNPENGLLFRRDTDINSDRQITLYSLDSTTQRWVSTSTNRAFGAYEVGKIEGAPGAAPDVELNSYSGVSTITGTTRISQGSYTAPAASIVSAGRTIVFATTADSNTVNAYIAAIKRTSNVPRFIDIKTTTEGVTTTSRVYLKNLVSSDTFEDYNYIPGKYQLNVFKGDVEYTDGFPKTIYNDEIQYISGNRKDPNNTSTTALIGFQAPYHTFDFTTTTAISPYDTPNVTNIDKHPSSSTLEFAIPRGVQGDSPENIHIISVKQTVDGDSVTFTLTGTENERIHLWRYDADEQEQEITSTSSRPSEFNGLTTFDIYVYVVRNFDNRTSVIIDDEDDNVKYYYIGLAKFIQNIQYDDESNNPTGQLSVTYTTGETDSLINKLAWVNSIQHIREKESEGESIPVNKYQLQNNLGQNVGDEIDLDYVSNLTYDNSTNERIGTGAFEAIWASTKKQTLIPKLAWVNTIQHITSERDNQYQLQFKNNLGENIEDPIDLNYVKGLTYNDNGLIIATWASEATEQLNTTHPIKYIESITTTRDADTNWPQMQINFNNGNPTTLNLTVVQTAVIKRSALSNVLTFTAQDFSLPDSQTIDQSDYRRLSGIYKTPVETLNTEIITILKDLNSSAETDASERFSAIIELLRRESSNPINDYIQYTVKGPGTNNSYYSYYTDGPNEISTITLNTIDQVNPKLIILYSSLIKRIKAIRDREAINFGGNYGYQYNSDYGWMDSKIELSTISPETLKIRYDITEEFEQAKPDTDEATLYGITGKQWQNYYVPAVKAYLNNTYPEGFNSSAIAATDSNIVTITAVTNTWRVAERADQSLINPGVTIADVNGTNVFIPTQNIKNDTDVVYSEPKTAFYTYNAALVSKIITLTAEQQTNYEGLQEKTRASVAGVIGDPLLSNATLTPVTGSTNTYTYTAWRGWYNISNLFTNSSSSSGTAEGNNILFTDSTQVNIENEEEGTMLVLYTEE